MNTTPRKTGATSAPDACPGHCAVGEAVNRRRFMERAALAAIGTLLAACGDGQFGPVALSVGPIPTGDGVTFSVASFAELATVGGIAVTSIGGFPIAIGRTGASTYAVWSLVCPHQGQAVSKSGSGFLCTGHNATWNAQGTWTGGQATSGLVVIPSTFDAATGVIALSGGAAPTFEQDFTIDLSLSANAALLPVGGWMFVTKPIPKSTRTTKMIVYNTPLQGYVAYAAACGHQAKYINYDTTKKHWKCPEHDAEFDVYGKKLVDANENTNVPTGNLVQLTVTKTGNVLRVQGNSPPQG